MASLLEYVIAKAKAKTPVEAMDGLEMEKDFKDVHSLHRLRKIYEIRTNSEIFKTGIQSS